MDILIKIFAYVFAAFLLLGILGLIFMLVAMTIASFKGRAPSGMPWWVFWAATHDDD